MEVSFPWKSIWKVNALLPFTWAVALGKILMTENLRERRIVVVDRCCLWKVSVEITDIPLIRRNIAKDLVFCALFVQNFEDYALNSI